jgi:hypothetical protein
VLVSTGAASTYDSPPKCFLRPNCSVPANRYLF